MKKMIKKIFGIISTFIIGTQSRIFAVEQTDVYGPAPDPSVSTATGGQIFSIVASILLFIIGFIVILNKNVNKKLKVITAIILFILIIILLLLSKFVF